MKLAAHSVISKASCLVVAVALAGIVVARPVPVAADTQTTTVTALADAYVNSAHATSKYGTSLVLKVDGLPMQRAYLRFDLSAVPAPITQLILHVYVTAGSSKGFHVRHVPNDGWSESTVTAATAPPADVAPDLPSGIALTGTWKDVDVTALLDGDTRLSLAVDTLSTSELHIASRETGAKAPLLIVTSETAAPTPTTTTTIAPTTTVAPTTTTTIAPSTTTTTTTAAAAPPVSQKNMYAYYYLWWSAAHWESQLGPNYPFTPPLPLPATLGAGDCNPQSLYVGNVLTDVPTAIYSQDTPGVIENHVRQAAAAHLAGFIVNWKGTGLVGQTTADITYSRRLAELARAVAEVNAEGIPFKIILNYAASQAPTLQEMTNDWAYLERTYANSPVLERFGTPRPLLIWNATGNYSVDVLRAMADRFRGSFYMIGSESWTTWTAERGAFLDGDTQYWSSQNPYTNAASFDQLASLAANVRASGLNPDGTAKMWMAPIAPGYDHLLGGGSSCVARNDGDTLRRLFAGNSRSAPDAWALISWNEISEGSYVEPLTRWGDFYLKSISALLTTP